MEGDHDHDHAGGDNIEVVGDIEQNTSPRDPDASSPARSTTGEIHIHDDDREDKISTSAAWNPESAAATKSTTTLSDAVRYRYIRYFGVVVIAIPSWILWIIYVIGSNCVSGQLKTPYDWFETEDEKGRGIYSKLIHSNFKSSITTLKFNRLTMMITCRVGCLLILWLLISLRIHALKEATFLGLIHWKWSLLAVLLSLGYSCLFTSIHFWSEIFVNDWTDHKGSACYFAVGLFNSIVSFIYVVFIFLVWMLYFHDDQHLATTSRGSNVDKYTTTTLTMVLVGAFLWVLKSAVLLRWKAKAIYNRFRGRILMAGFRLYLLNLILDAKSVSTLIPWRNKEIDSDESQVKDYKRSSTIAGNFKRRSIQDRLMVPQNASIYELKVVTRYLTDLARDPSRDDDRQISDILGVYQEMIGSDKYVTKKEIRQLVKGDDAELLIEELQEEFPSMKVNQVPFQKWAVDAHKSCVNVGYMLIDAFAMVKVLNTILTWCIIVVVTLLWLLVTELATTKVLVVIGSPFLALTFVFGDTCKTFFQGFIFAFINHPFDIGDRCIIDGVEVEVKRVSIMTTTCLKIGTKERMLYPNSDIATKLIINLEDKPDPTDFIEVLLDSSTKMSDISKLRKHIESYIGRGVQRQFFEKSCRVVVKEMGNNIKIIIYFQHTMNIAQDVSQSQFLEKKETQRSNLFSEVKQFLDGLSVKVET